jgi:hypothetical protein
LFILCREDDRYELLKIDLDEANQMEKSEEINEKIK